MRETVIQIEQVIVESPYPEAVVTMVENLATEAAGVSTVQDTTLVVVSTSLLSLPSCWSIFR
jgi:hypothetical protein